MNSGSLGHGLPVAVGMALAGKMDEAPYRVYTVMGDGELAEGSVWEGVMAAGHYKLDNLCAKGRFPGGRRRRPVGTVPEGFLPSYAVSSHLWAAVPFGV